MKIVLYSLIYYVAIYWPRLIAAQGDHYHWRPLPFDGRNGRFNVACDPAKRYRLVDGKCNNLDNSLWGSAFTPLDRALPSAFQDGVSSPRLLGVDGQLLPSARNVSVNCHPPSNTTAKVTLMIMHWGQFLDHDITLTMRGTDDCTCDSTRSECFPIPLSNDEYFKTRECLEFRRSDGISATDRHSTAAIRQQINALTAYIDASNVYGSTDEELAAVRGSNVFELKVSTDCSGKDFLPPHSDAHSCRPDRGKFCFLAGDSRPNVQPGLGAVHTLFVREHNRIAQLLSSNTRWSNERIFQETRKIVGAMMQRITYNEFLPIVLGPEYMNRYGLKLSDYKYNSSLRADVLNAFATAALRFAHSLIPDELELSSNNSLLYKDVFLKPHHVISSFDDLFSRGALQKSTGSDRFFSHSITRHLFQIADTDGFDLIARNIQRGRDHGLPSYNEYRKWCGLEPMTSLLDLYPDDPIAASVYRSIDDVDLYTGGMSEEQVEGGLVGPTFACILGTQFQRLKSGDRFFYLNEDSVVRFSQAQLNQINKVTLSKVICDNTDLESIQENIFLPEDETTNPSKDCEHLPGMKLNPWAPRLLLHNFDWHR